MSTTGREPATVQDKPNEFEASGDSPPAVAMPARLVEELAEILADALVADYESQQK